MSVIEQALAFLSDTQTDILLFFVSISIHALLFRKYSGGKKKGGKKPSLVRADGASCQDVRGMFDKAEDGAEASQLFQEAVSGGLVDTEVLVEAANAAKTHHNKALAKAVVKELPSTSPKEVAVAVLRLCATNNPLERQDSAVLELYSQHFKGADLSADAEVEQLVINSAVCCKDFDVLQNMMCSVTRLTSLLKRIAIEYDLIGLFSIFRGCPQKTAGMYHALVEVCLERHDLTAAERALQDGAQSKLADTATFVAVAKAHLQKNDTRRAGVIVKALGGNHMNTLTCSPFNDLIEVTRGEGAWGLIEAMRSCGLKPNHVTCSLMLKSASRSKTKTNDTEWVLELVDELGESMTESVLSLALDLCMQKGCHHLVGALLRKHWGTHKIQAKSAYTYASIFRAHGVSNNIRGVWDTWQEMKRRNIAPASVTLGCMVEALASNGDPEAGYMVIREHIGNPQLRPLVNAVIYCSVLKGFSHQKRFDKVWAVYQEMKGERLQFSIVTYNTLVDACSRCKELGRIPALLEEMAAVKIEPNTITYSAIIKGYCSSPDNRMAEAFELLQEMKGMKHVLPDEVTYNTVLDGCARFALWERGMALLVEMQEVVPPSNFTLSVLIKLASRCKRPYEETSKMTKELCAKYRIRPNVHVFNNLIHACTLKNNLHSAEELYAQMLGERIRPDARTYMLLLQGAVSARSATVAGSLLRAAGGVRDPHPAAAKCTQLAQPKGGLSSDVVSEAIEGIASMCRDEPLAIQLLGDLKGVSSLPVDSRRLLRSTCKALVDA